MNAGSQKSEQGPERVSQQRPDQKPDQGPRQRPDRSPEQQGVQAPGLEAGLDRGRQSALLRSARALVAGIAAACCAWAAAGVGSVALQRVAERHSHRLPTPDPLWESAVRASPEHAAEGRKLFLQNCAHCHGADATGDEGPDLHDDQMSDRYIARMITQGVPHQMPSFARKLAAPAIADLTAYLRTLD